MEGEIVKIAIKLAGKTQAEIADIIGISREHFQKMLKKDVSSIYVEKIRKAGINIEAGILKSDEKRLPSMSVIQDMVRMINKTIDMLEKSQHMLEKNQNTIEKDHSFYQEIIHTAIKEGKLKIEGNLTLLRK
jgi:transcriptional regulator with XRE-family HTH domain